MEIAKIVLPALMVLITAYLIINKLISGEEKRRDFEITKNNISVITPIRLRAYERLMLLLERTSPSMLIISNTKPGMFNLDLQHVLLEKIREEFTHNLSQQIYVSDELWSCIRTAQESIVQLVNSSASKCNPDNPATQLAELILKVYASSELHPADYAKTVLKKEIRTLM